MLNWQPKKKTKEKKKKLRESYTIVSKFMYYNGERKS